MSDVLPPDFVEVHQVRQCDGCTLCCKVMSIAALQKPKGKWCPHCKPGTGCTIYETRPEECRAFLCGYLTNPHLGDEWRPSKSKLVVTSEVIQNRIAIHVDPGHPEAWRQSPFYEQMKEWSIRAAPSRGQVVVKIGDRAIMVFPDRDVDLGRLGEDDLIVTGERTIPGGGIALEAYTVKRDEALGQKIEAAKGGSVSAPAGTFERLKKGTTI